MKQQATEYLALDVHQATSVATVRDASGAISMRATVPTEAKAIINLIKGINPPVHVAFEEGTHTQWLHDLLQPHVERVVVCNVRGRADLGTMLLKGEGGAPDLAEGRVPLIASAEAGVPMAQRFSPRISGRAFRI